MFRRIRNLTLLMALVGGSAHAQGLLNMESANGQPVELSGDELQCTKTRCELIGDVFLRSGTTLMSAKQLELDIVEQDGKRKIAGARARGDVLLVDGNIMTACQFMELGPDLVKGALSLAEVRVKKPGTTGITQGWDKFGAGSDQLYMTGHITRTGPRSFLVKDVYFTPCDCGKNIAPVFSLKAKEATVELGSHAIFKAPMLQPLDVALPFPFAFPALYVPVSKRKTGILPPAFSVFGADGFYIEESVFIALTQSLDMTVTAGLNVSRGLREKYELRYAPTSDSEGQLSLSHMLDGKLGALTKAGAAYADFLDNSGFAHRFGGTFVHRSGTWSRFGAKANLQFYSDQTFLFDNSFTLAAQAIQYAPSRLAFDYRGEDWRVQLGGAAYQDFSVAAARVCAADGVCRYAGGGENARATPGLQAGMFSATMGRTLSRLPDVAFNLAPLPLGGGVTLAADVRGVGSFSFGGAQLVRYDPVAGAPLEAARISTSRTSSDPLATRDCNVFPSTVSVMDGVYTRTALPCQKPLRYGRLDVVPRLSRPFFFGPVEVKPELFGLLAGGADSIVESMQARGFLGLRVDAETMFSRVFGTLGQTQWRHRMRPILRYLLIPGVFGALPAFRLDERDYYGATHQLAAAFETDLFRKKGDGSTTRVLSLALLQGANLGWPVIIGDPSAQAAKARPSELGAKITFDWSPLAVALRGAYDHATGRPSYYGARAGVTHKYFAINADFTSYRAGGYYRMNTGIFELVPGGAITPDKKSGAFNLLSGGINFMPLRGLVFGATAGYSFDETFSARPFSTAFQGMTARASYTGICDCFGVDVQVSLLPWQLTSPIVNFSLTLGDYVFRPQ